MSFCSQCGGENPQNAKFCVNCGAKLEQAVENANTDGQASASVQQSEGAYFSIEPEWDPQSDSSAQGDSTQYPVFEKVTEFEEFTPDPIPNLQQSEININYGGGDNSYQQGYGNAAFETQTAQSIATGNIGISVASLVCGIISLLCCCSGVFGAVLGIAAIVLGTISLYNKYDGKGMAIAGIATGGVALFLCAILLIVAIGNGVTNITDNLW